MTAAVVPLLAAALAFDPAAAAKAVAPFAGETTVAAARIDLKRVNASTTVTALLKGADLDPAEGIGASLAAGLVQQWLDKLTKAGVAEVYAVIDVAPPPVVPVRVVVPVPAGADANVVKQLVEAGPFAKAKPFGWVAAGDGVVTAGWGRPPSDTAPSPRPELADAFALAGDAPVAVAVVPPEALRRLIEETVPALPKALGGHRPAVLARGLKYAALALTTPDLGFTATAEAADADAAKQLADLAGRTLDAAAKEMRPGAEWAGTLLRALRTRADGGRVTVEFPGGDAARAVAVDAAKAARTTALYAAAASRLKQLLLGMHMYAAAHKDELPADVRGPDGKPLLSWRVAVLPYVGQEALYKRFKLDEPWDGEHNRALAAKVPDVFRHPASKAAAGRATFLLPVGPGTAFPGGAATKLPAGFPDGTVNTALVVDAADDAAVEWARPADWTPDPKEPAKGLALRNTRHLIATADGAVHRVSPAPDRTMWRALFTPAGGEALNVPW